MKSTRLLLTLCLLALATTALYGQEPTPVIEQPAYPIFGQEQADFIEAMHPILFDFNDHVINAPGEEKAIDHDAKWLNAHPNVHFTIEGYTDWRGSVPYNMLLAQRRADAAKNALVAAGVSPDRISFSVGWGKLTQVCSEADDACYAKNRRVHLVYDPTPGSGAAAGQ